MSGQQIREQFGEQTSKQSRDQLLHQAASAAAKHPEWSLGLMAGRSLVMQRLFAQMRSTAPHLRIATLEGQSGTGKETAARTLHALGPAASGIFLPCPAPHFFEHLPAVIRESRDGTLLLNHIEDLTAAQQARLLDFLQWLDHQHARRLPDSAPRQVFFSTNLPVRKLVSAFSLRIDLANRLTVIRFTLPPLRERREDIPLLADFFAERFSVTHNKPVRGLGPQSLPRLLTHPWPGNVRELENTIHAAAMACEGQWIRPIDIPSLSPGFSVGSTDLAGPDNDAGRGSRQDTPAEDPSHDPNHDPNLDRAILRHITLVLAQVDGNKLRAARLLGISRSTLYRLLESRRS
ncbi:sigma-54-dependent transcriptional regulator [Silvibacterium bohemicum]|uniref:sigma-54-dependent transcriptional regulator n=1 Tax=Silvibacterium bohemicum TaxID=1577686 RepID=UPI001E5E465D|nr:sigma 54-interacting transcriptional regulator [Silvibacterium bohemicum]